MSGEEIVTLSTQVICKQPGRYIGWPTVARTDQGELLVVFSGDRDAHVCPYGKTQIVRSSDDGSTWSAPETINDTPLDDRDAGIVVTRSGAVVVSWFTSVASEARMLRYREQYGDEAVDRWQATIDSLTAGGPARMAGALGASVGGRREAVGHPNSNGGERAPRPDRAE